MLATAARRLMAWVRCARNSATFASAAAAAVASAVSIGEADGAIIADGGGGGGSGAAAGAGAKVTAFGLATSAKEANVLSAVAFSAANVTMPSGRAAGGPGAGAATATGAGTSGASKGSLHDTHFLEVAYVWVTMQRGLRHNLVGLDGVGSAGAQGSQGPTAAADSSLSFSLRAFFLALRLAFQPALPLEEAALLAELLLPAEAERAGRAGLGGRGVPRVPLLLEGERPRRPFWLLSVWSGESAAGGCSSHRPSAVCSQSPAPLPWPLVVSCPLAAQELAESSDFPLPLPCTCPNCCQRGCEADRR